MGLRFAPTTPDLTELHDAAAEALRVAEAADERAANARQMVLNRDPTLTRAATDAATAAADYANLAALALTVEQRTKASEDDRANLHRLIAELQAKPAPVVCGGSVAVPALVLGASTDLTIALNATMPNSTYRVTTVPGSLLGRVGVVVKARTTTSVTITVTATLAVAVGQSITVICS